MTDIATVETVDVGGYEVRVGHSDDGSEWDAVVVGEGSSGSSAYTGMLTFSVTQSAGSSSDEPELGPAVSAPHKWVAAGLAVEAYEWREAGDDDAVMSARECYDGMSVPNDIEGMLEDVDVDEESIVDELEENSADGN